MLFFPEPKVVRFFVGLICKSLCFQKDKVAKITPTTSQGLNTIMYYSENMTTLVGGCILHPALPGRWLAWQSKRTIWMLKLVMDRGLFPSTSNPSLLEGNTHPPFNRTGSLIRAQQHGVAPFLVWLCSRVAYGPHVFPKLHGKLGKGVHLSILFRDSISILLLK